MKIDISKLNKADVLAALYNASKIQGMGIYSAKSFGHEMDRQEAQNLLDEGGAYFDYLYGKVMKVDLSSDELNPWGYDRDNGEGAAERAISSIGVNA